MSLKQLKSVDTTKQRAYDPYVLGYNVYNHEKHTIKKNENIDNFLYDGIHRICYQEYYSIDILIQGLDKLQNSKYIIVCLSGAVTNREGKRAPFFSGISLARTLNNALISIADPTLALDEKISTGWYTGNHNIKDFPETVGYFLDKVASRLNKKLLFCGGSAGGYGSLLIASYLKTETILLIWNPQTILQNYAAFAFELFQKITLGKNRKDFFEPIVDIRNRHIPDNVQVLYLQNITDYHHCEKMLYPYMEGKDYYLIGNSTFVNDTNNVVISLGNFGEGHVPPSRDLILFLMRHLMKKESAVHTAWLIDEGIPKLHKSSSKIITLKSYENFPFAIKTHIQDNQLKIECEFEGGNIDNGQFRFAYYLLYKDVRIDATRYSHNNICTFVLPENINIEDLSIVCFARDIFGIVTRKRIELYNGNVKIL